MQMQESKSLSVQREEAAQRCFELYNFETAEVVEAGGWESTTPGCEMTRTVYLAPLPDDESSTEASDRAFFTVRFESAHSAEVKEVFALMADKGTLVGHR